jgi:hypothetical protein
MPNFEAQGGDGLRSYFSHPEALMKSILIVIALIAIAVIATTTFTTSRKPGIEKAAGQSPDSSAKQIEIDTDTPRAEKAEDDFTQKSRFVSRMQTQLSGLRQELDAFAARVEKGSDAAKAEARPKLEALREQIARLDTQLEETKRASQSAWTDVKTASRKGLDDAKDTFHQARQWLSDKIAP